MVYMLFILFFFFFRNLALFDSVLFFCLVEYLPNQKMFWKKRLLINNINTLSCMHLLLDNLLLEVMKGEELSSFFYVRQIKTYCCRVTSHLVIIKRVPKCTISEGVVCLFNSEAEALGCCSCPVRDRQICTALGRHAVMPWRQELQC